MLAPKKANWDLKRDIEPKMSLLQRRTERAIAALRKELLASESEPAPPVAGGDDNLVARINAHGAKDAESDDEE